MIVENVLNGTVMWQDKEEPESAILLKVYTNGIDIIQEGRSVYITKYEVESFIKELRKLNKLGFKNIQG